MSDASQSKDNKKLRYLRPEEIDLIRNVVAAIPLYHLDKIRVYDLSDGGMGSVRVADQHPPKQKFREAGSSLFLDTDGVQVSIAVNVDEKDNFYEIDMWKVDFSPIISYPKI